MLFLKAQSNSIVSSRQVTLDSFFQHHSDSASSHPSSLTSLPLVEGDRIGAGTGAEAGGEDEDVISEMTVEEAGEKKDMELNQELEFSPPAAAAISPAPSHTSPLSSEMVEESDPTPPLPPERVDDPTAATASLAPSSSSACSSSSRPSSSSSSRKAALDALAHRIREERDYSEQEARIAKSSKNARSAKRAKASKSDTVASTIASNIAPLRRRSSRVPKLKRTDSQENALQLVAKASKEKEIEAELPMPNLLHCAACNADEILDLPLDNFDNCWIQCCVNECGAYFHARCAKMTLEEWNKYNDGSEEDWLCPTCKITSSSATVSDKMDESQ